MKKTKSKKEGKVTPDATNKEKDLVKKLPESESRFSNDSRAVSESGSLFDLRSTISEDMQLHLSLCGCGFLGIYHLGVATCLVKHGQGFLSGVEKYAGASAGSLISAMLLIDQDKIDDCTTFTFNLAKKIRSKPFGALTPRFNLLKPVREFLEEALPVNAHEKATGRLFLSLTNTRSKKNEVMCEFDTREELIQALIASSYIPFYAGTKPPTIRGHKFMDGGMTNNLPDFPYGRTISVSPFCGSQDICPQDKKGKSWFISQGNQDYQVNWSNILRGSHAFFPPSRRILQEYFDKGERDAGRFLRKEGWYETKVPKPVKKEYMTLYESAV
ncbi:patatin-like phospholipase domain-containing protein 4 isoform X2 [Patella vulgata]|nr:patatin-like phospholipase domain-containing protein 4 isoform X2 [Patella vulgata]